MATVERVEVVRDGHWSARTISILRPLPSMQVLFGFCISDPIQSAAWRSRDVLGSGHCGIWSLFHSAAMDARQPNRQR